MACPPGFGREKPIQAFPATSMSRASPSIAMKTVPNLTASSRSIVHRHRKSKRSLFAWSSSVDPKILATVTLCIPGPEVVYRRTEITVVLVRGEVNDYAAYIGAGGDAEFVRRFGNKMSYAEAIGFFPSMVLE